MSAKPTDIVTASEIASWAWCPESWRLETLGAVPGNDVELARGEEHHARTARAEVSSRSAMSFGVWLLVIGVGAALVAFVISKAVGG